MPRRRPTGLPFGDVASRRRGHGSDIIGARPYEPGDPVASIDWFASARASSVGGGDEFIVREHAADEAPRVVVVVDRRPAMGLYPPPLPWFVKRDALRAAVAAIAASAAAARADLAALDFGEGQPYWIPPGRRERQWQIAERENGSTPFRAAEDNLVRALEFLRQRRAELPPASFVFILSDFLQRPAAEAWQDAVAHGWDVVPVVIQDPVWEQSFPEVGGVAVPVADPRTGRLGLVRFSEAQARRRREENKRRYDSLIADLESFGLHPVAITASDPTAVDGAFIEWAEDRRRSRWAR
ncbi:MAG: DUF58 domain-containing protein [Gaiellaceae bacterium]